MTTESALGTTGGLGTRINPCIWFDDDLEEAAAFYTALFPRSSVGHMARYPESGPGETGTVMAGEFTLDGLTFKGINGGPVHAQHTESISFSITCADQAEVDHYWYGLTADGGEESVCGWLKDRFGLSWQVVPQRLFDLQADPDAEVRNAAVAAMMQMTRIVVADLDAAVSGLGGR